MQTRTLIDLTLESARRVSRVSVPSAALTADYVEAQDPADYEFAVKGDAHYLALHGLIFEDGLMQVDGDRSYRSQDLRNTLTFLPAGTPARGWCKPAKGDQSFTALYLDTKAIPQSLQIDHFLKNPIVYFRSEQLGQTFGKIANAIRQSPPFLEFVIDMLGHVALLELAAYQSANVTRINERQLHPDDIRRLRQFLRDNIARDIRLDEMASVVGLSKFHFTRCFRAATGRTPYRSLLEFRSEVAIAELKAGRSPQDAAIAAGFEGVPQMSRTIRAILGVSIRKLR
ncbi:helix-turn-helix domain-containing protein [Bosea sp. PAMC 26642]|uniref:helix-turn-helix domain-containing protein n=1 Tax=Bosea sp. (strain PAMC 26642) TaxID=1792307 RepID=UPI0009EB2EBB|nr:AraC family transcriptional regulator [Bosea sp. PAMC 26642]